MSSYIFTPPIETNEPFLKELVSGSSFEWEYKPTVEYLPSDGYDLKVYLRGPTTIDLDSTSDTQTETFTVAVVASSNTYTPGYYSYSIVAIHVGNDERVVIRQGFTTIKADPLNIVAGTDNTSHAQKALDSIEAILEQRATKDQMSYSINGRSLSRIPVMELLSLRDYYKAEVQRQTKTLPRRVHVTFRS